jgi:hypothetical protein
VVLFSLPNLPGAGQFFSKFQHEDEKDAYEENLHVVFNRVAFFGKRSMVASTNGRRHREGPSPLWNSNGSRDKKQIIPN